jgi:lipopolysaccharide transport system ATP-binding protein
LHGSVSLGFRKPEKDLLMSSKEFAIRVEGLGKRYEIYDAPRDRLKQFFVPQIRRIAGLGERSFFREHWALKGVSFEVKKGESIGIVGKNGSGKSTLLQLIVGTLSATTGFVETQGRIAALLELGSGFNPDYTGRENAYLNGALLGLSHEEMDGLMPGIARFAGIGDFFDQPVKRYSSGMVVRVAFAVQAQVNPDILIVDEALAVGDAVFQHKCARRIHELRERGTTLLFVSHDPAAVATFCDRALLLHEGEQVAVGSAKEIIELYLARNKQELYVSDGQGDIWPVNNDFLDYVPVTLGNGKSEVELKNVNARIGTGDAQITRVSIFDELGRAALKRVQSGKKFRIRTRIVSAAPLDNLSLCYRIDTLMGVQITGSTSSHDKVSLPGLTAAQYMDIDIETSLPLKPDTYSLGLYLNRTPVGLPPVVIDGLETVAHIQVDAPEEISPIYIFDTPRRWIAMLGEPDPAKRLVTRYENGADVRWKIRVLESEFTAPDHWFWPQYGEGWETDTFLIFRRFLHRGSKFVDVGAWVGATVMYASALGATNIHTVEANPATVKLLAGLVDRSPILGDSVTIHNLCISDSEGMVSFGNVDGSHATSSAASMRGTGFTVPSKSLYEFLRSNSLLDADLLKVDIEGAEELIGADLRRLSHAGVKAIHLSLHPPFWKPANFPVELFDAIREFDVYDSRGNALALDELVRRSKATESHPEWGTQFGNFFEILLLPKRAESTSLV